jgi:hypothetical protein
MQHKKKHIVRRSVALPHDLVREALAVASPDTAGNLNRLVVQSLAEFIARRKAQAFEDAMARMGADPAIRAECKLLSAGLAHTESDGLTRG